jgi:hypothetical protein
MRILNCGTAFNGLARRQRLLHALRAEIKTLFIVTQGHRLWHIFIRISIEFRHYAVVMVKISVGRDLILISEAFLACIIIQLGTVLVKSPRSNFGRALGVSIYVRCHYIWQRDLLVLARHLLVLMPQLRLRRRDALGAGVPVAVYL